MPPPILFPLAKPIGGLPAQGVGPLMHQIEVTAGRNIPGDPTQKFAFAEGDALAITDAVTRQGSFNRQAGIQSVVIADSFNRVVGAGGLGTADTGGAWTNQTGGAASSVDGASARLAPAAGSASTNALQSTTVRDSLAFACWTMDVAPTSEVQQFYLCQRGSGSGDRGYEGLVQVDPTTRVLYVDFYSHSAFSELFIGETNTGIVWSVGQRIMCEFEVRGVNPTLLRARTWIEGTPRPDWQLTATSSLAALQTTGWLTMLSYHNSGNAPVVTVDQVGVVTLPTDPLAVADGGPLLLQTAQASSSGSSSIATFGVAPKTSSTLVAVVGNDVGSNLVSGCGATWVEVAVSGANQPVSVFIGTTPNGSGTTVTGTWTGGAGDGAITVYEFDGTLTFDVGGAANGTSLDAPSALISPTTAASLIVTGATWFAVNVNGPAGFTQSITKVLGATARQLTAAWRVTSERQSRATWREDSASSWDVAIAAFSYTPRTKRTVQLGRITANSLAITDVATRIGTWLRTVADTLTISDVVTRIGSFFRSPQGIAFIQKATNLITSGTSNVVTLGANPKTGDALVVLSSATADRVTGISGGGVTWALLKQSVFSFFGIDVWYGLNSSGSGTSITITYGSSTRADAMVVEYSGVKAVSAADTTNTNSGSGTAVTTGSALPSDVPALLLAMVGWRNDLSSAISGPDSGFSSLGSVGPAVTAMLTAAYKVQTTSPVSQNVGWTLTDISGSVWEAVIAVLLGDKADGMTITDAATQSKVSGGINRTAADTLTITDAVTRVLVLGRTTANTLGITDAVTRIGTFGRTTADSLGITDAATRIGTFLRTAAQTLGITDAATRTGTFLRTTADSLTITDAATGSRTYLRSVADSLGITDVATRTGTFIRSTADSLGITDAVTRLLNLGRTASQTLTITDVANGSRTYFRSVADSLTISDSATRIVSLGRSLADSLGITDAATRTLSLVRSTANSITFGTVATRAITLVRTATQSLTITDVVTRNVALARRTFNSLTISDSAVAILKAIKFPWRSGSGGMRGTKTDDYPPTQTARK